MQQDLNTDQNLDQDIREVILKEHYYKDHAADFLYITILGAGLIIILIFLIGYIISSKPKPQYFVVDEKKQIFASVPLNEPIYNNAQIRDWAAQIMLRLYDLNYINYPTRVEQNASLFTPDGYKKYIAQLSSIDLPTLVNGKFVSKAVLCNIVKIDFNTTGVYNIDTKDTYVWTLTLPMNIQYQSKDTYNVAARVVMRVQRVSELDYLGGLVISDIAVYDRINVNGYSDSKTSACNG